MISSEKEYQDYIKKIEKEERKYDKKVKRDINKILIWGKFKKIFLGIK